MSTLFDSFKPWKGKLRARVNGSLVATAPGKATAYSLFAIQARGILFIEPGEEIYPGME